MPKEIKHISGSFLNSYENYRDDFVKTYVYWERVPENIYMKFGKDYEDVLAEFEYKDYSRQEKLDEDFEWYKVVWYYDFVNDNETVEVKTKSGWWSANEIRKNWQFRLYNHYRKTETFKIHQYNKKRKETKIQDIWFDDPEFEAELYCKILEINEFLSKYNVKICRN